ncbi:hypothetical protein [Escherichia coli]|uniref:hypothetical protein n=1 Tax=Escherichia coli TaxID=562 RepID=UPI00203E8797|nr:hypothetical protein [Escherichia coli]
MLRIGQVEATATQDGKYTDGSVAGGIAATRLRAAAFNAMQEELAHIVESTGVVLDVDDTTQVLVALQKIFAGNSDALGALAGLTGAANKLPYFTGPKAAALADLTAFAREILAQTDAAGVLTKLGLGTAAEIDVATNAEVITGIEDKAVTAASLKNRFNTVVLYPNGTEASPPTLTANQRIVIDNPFPGRPVVAQVEVFANNIWAAPYFMSTPQGNAGPTAGATPSYLYETDKIVIQTGVDGVLYKSNLSGSAHNFTTGGDVFSGTIYSSRTYRLRVRAI